MLPLCKRTRSALPGFRLSLGFTLAYLGLIVLVPLSAAFMRTAGMSWPDFVAAAAGIGLATILRGGLHDLEKPDWKNIE